MRSGRQLVLELTSELASELYVADVVDGEGRLQSPEGLLRRDVQIVTLDKPGSVSGLRPDRFSLRDQMDASRAEPDPSFISTLWEGTAHE